LIAPGSLAGIVVKVAAVTGGWIWMATPSVRTKKRSARTTLSTMISATVILLLALLWPKAEGVIVSMMTR